jgi:hypothetical protein
MNSHELANLLLSMPDLPVGLSVNHHDYFSDTDEISHGSMDIILANHYAGDHIVIGNVDKEFFNCGNWSVKKLIYRKEEE